MLYLAASASLVVAREFDCGITAPGEAASFTSSMTVVNVGTFQGGGFIIPASEILPTGVESYAAAIWFGQEMLRRHNLEKAAAAAAAAAH